MSKVPNTDNFNLEDVVAAVGSHATVSRNLNDCFLKANASYFDPAYNNNTYAGETTGKSLKRFRNYTPVTAPPANPIYATAVVNGVTINPRGLVLCMSDNGENVYMYIMKFNNYGDTSRATHAIVRYTLSTPYDISTIAYHSQLNISDPPSGTTVQDIMLSGNGTKLSLLYSTWLDYTTIIPKIHTYSLSSYALPGSNTYSETLVHASSGLNRIKSFSMSEDKTKLYFMVYAYNHLRLERLPISTDVMPTGYSITTTETSGYGTQGIYYYIKGMHVFDSQNMVEIFTYSGSAIYIRGSLLVDNPFNAAYAPTTMHSFSNPYLEDAFTDYQRRFMVGIVDQDLFPAGMPELYYYPY